MSNLTKFEFVNLLLKRKITLLDIKY